MAKRPNALGRIEGEPKVRWYKKVNWGVYGKAALVVGLITLGVVATLQVQKSYNDIKAQGVAEFKANECKPFTNKENTQKWLECDD